jgi:hypothetical protein
MRWAPVLLLFAACHRDPLPAAAPAPAATPAAVPQPAPAPKKLAFVNVPKLPSAPIKVNGYPHNIRNGMNDPPEFLGFTEDGKTFVTCGPMGGIEGESCAMVDDDGKRWTMAGTHEEPKKRKEIADYLRDHKVWKVKPRSIWDADGPPLTGSWDFSDITLDVVRIAASGETPDGSLLHPAHVQVGGAVAGEAPVHPLVFSSNPVPQAPPHWTALDAFVLSPDGQEFGFAADFFACEYCESSIVDRMRTNTLASMIYNDTGFRHHKKKEWAAAAALFEKAVAADPTARLPPYNLACAWARLGDPRAKQALAYAAEIDPTVATRAKTDPDLESLR